MNILFRHIQFLLTRHDCVIVPGLGAFIVTTAPAVIDRVNRRVFPPSRSVMFNQAVTLDDGLLANSYARRLDLSFEEARQTVLKDVTTLLDTLRQERYCEAGNLGSFILGDENQVIFQPLATPTELSERNGLYSFYLSAPSSKSATISHFDDIEETPGMESQPQSLESKPQNLESQQQSLECEPETIDSSTDSSDKQYFQFRINRSVIKFTAIFAVFAAIALAVLLYPVPHDVREHRASVVPVEALIPTPTQKQVEPKTIVSDTIPRVEKVIETETTATVTEPVTKTEEYFLIVATFHTKKEAERFATLHSSPDFKLETVSSRKVTRVYASSSADKKELLTELRSSKISKAFPNAWIWSSAD